MANFSLTTTGICYPAAARAWVTREMLVFIPPRSLLTRRLTALDPSSLTAFVFFIRQLTATIASLGAFFENMANRLHFVTPEKVAEVKQYTIGIARIFGLLNVPFARCVPVPESKFFTLEMRPSE